METELIHNAQAIAWIDVWEIIHISLKGHSLPAKCLSISQKMSACWAAPKKFGFSFKPKRNSSCPFHSVFRRILKSLHLFPEWAVTAFCSSVVLTTAILDHDSLSKPHKLVPVTSLLYETHNICAEERGSPDGPCSNSTYIKAKPWNVLSLLSLLIPLPHD